MIQILRAVVLSVVATSAAGCVAGPVATGAQGREAASDTSAAPAPGPASASRAAREFNVIGAADAPVTIIEFTDLQCPYCARFALQTFPRLRQEYVDRGKLRYASRDLPLPMHEFAVPAAVAARCAGEQGRYWEFRNAIFAAQERMGQGLYDDVAADLALDTARFETCRNDGHQRRQVEDDTRLARSFGIASTPSFVIGRIVDGRFDGETFSGAKPFEFVAAKIDALLDERLPPR